MFVKDKELKKLVDVSDKDCPTRPCYWPRLNPGSFQQGRGYRSYGDKRDKEWICGRRAVSGCPIPKPEVEQVNVNFDGSADVTIRLKEK